jgi:Zn-dependent peptidase ImmA (M78 family)
MSLDYVDRALSAPRTRLVAQVLADKRRLHQQLTHAPSLEALHQVANREGIRVRFDRLHRAHGMAIQFLGDSYVVLDRGLPLALQRAVLAHELGHLWLGHCAESIVRQWRSEEARVDSPFTRSRPVYDRCEAEADVFAAQLLGLTLDEYRASFGALFLRVAEAA